MASVMDVSLLAYFAPIFTFLFVFVVAYAVLDKFALLGTNKGVKLVASFSVAILFLFSASAVKLVSVITPWFVVLVVIAMFLIALFMFMGVKEDSVIKAVGSGTVVWTVILIASILMIIALVHVFSNVLSPYGGEDAAQDSSTSDISATTGSGQKTRESESLNTLVNPRILGMLFLLIIASFAISLISKGLK